MGTRGPQPGSRRLSRAELELRRERIAQLYARDYTPSQIAREIGISKQLAFREMQVLNQRWRDSQLVNFNEGRQRWLDELRELKRTAWREFEGTHGERKSTRTRQRKMPTIVPPAGWNGVSPEDAARLVRFPGLNGHGGNGDVDAPPERVEQEAMVRVEQRDPDPRFLLIVKACLDEEAKVLGYYPDSVKPIENRDEPVRRVVVYMERPPDGLGEEPDPESEPPTNGHVIDVPSRQLPSPDEPESDQ